MTASRAAEAEVKFAQGAKPGKGGQLPGKKVSPRIAHQRGCEPGYELVSPPVNHNLYSIEDVKLMVESWRHLNPDVRAALKFVATHGVEMACMGGVDFGRVSHLFSTGANDVLVAHGDRERMIPFVQPDYIRSVDFDAGLVEEEGVLLFAVRAAETRADGVVVV